MSVPLHDAHNHLQDERLKPYVPSFGEVFSKESIRAMVVNGATESDWSEVLELRKSFPQVLPSFGLHPWYIRERSAHWREHLERMLDAAPSAIGEIGLDRWVKDHDIEDQEKVFVEQWHIAKERNLPASVHCLHAWGKLIEILRREKGLPAGFVLHSYGGPAEMIPELKELGAYFSLPGYFAHERKLRQRETFKSVPMERLLIETDSPDQCLPTERVLYPLPESKEHCPLNHPGNLRAVYHFAAELLGFELERLAQQVAENFQRLFGRLLRSEVKAPE